MQNDLGVLDIWSDDEEDECPSENQGPMTPVHASPTCCSAYPSFSWDAVAYKAAFDSDPPPLKNQRPDFVWDTTALLVAGLCVGTPASQI